MLISEQAVRRRATSVPERMGVCTIVDPVSLRWERRHQRPVSGGQNGYQKMRVQRVAADWR